VAEPRHSRTTSKREEKWEGLVAWGKDQLTPPRAKKWGDLYKWAGNELERPKPHAPELLHTIPILLVVFVLVVGGLGLYNWLNAQRATETVMLPIIVHSTMPPPATDTPRVPTPTPDLWATAQVGGATATREKELADQHATTTVEAARFATRVVALNLTGTAQACAASNLYALNVSSPTLFPPEGSVYVVGNQPPALRVTWVVTNTGQCAWEDIRLRSIDPGTEEIPMLKGKRVQPGEVVEISVPFSIQDITLSSQSGVMRDYFVVVRNPLGGDHVLLDQPHLVVSQESWLRIVTPTPTPTPTNTGTPAPTPTLHCEKECDTCTGTVRDPITNESKSVF
jgi:hypothetical protein